jgi:hypothetical protein
MSYYHKQSAAGRWQQFSLVEQMANVGSDVHRMISWRDRNAETSRLAFERALELLDLTKADPKNRRRLKEICRVRELVGDFYFENQYGTTDEFWENYFYAFNYAARRGR